MGVRERGSGARGSDERVGEKEAGDDSFPLEPPANRTRTSGETGHPSFLNDRGGDEDLERSRAPFPINGDDSFADRVAETRSSIPFGITRPRYDFTFYFYNKCSRA